MFLVWPSRDRGRRRSRRKAIANYDYNLNGVFFKDLKLKDPDVYMEAVGNDLGETMGNIIAKSYQLMVQTRPDAVLVLGDTNSCLSVIGAKRLHIPIFHMVQPQQTLNSLNLNKLNKNFGVIRTTAMLPC